MIKFSELEVGTYYQPILTPLKIVKLEITEVKHGIESYYYKYENDSGEIVEGVAGTYTMNHNVCLFKDRDDAKEFLRGLVTMKLNVL